MPTEVRAMPVTDLSDPIMFSNPFPRYAELRRDAPVSRVIHQQGRRVNGYMLTRYEDVMLLHTDARFSSDPMKNSKAASVMRFMPRMLRVLSASMAFKDDPDHKRLRALVNKAFTPKRVQLMAGDIDQTADELVAALEGHDSVDLVEGLAVPLPLAVISEMMGVNEADRAQFHTWVKSFTENASGSGLEMVRAIPAGRKMFKFFERMAHDRRVEPDDKLITALVRANDEGDKLSEQEVVAMTFLLLLAGHDTTSNLIGSGVLALLDNPGQLQRLRDDPTLIDTAVEELLRYTTPVPCGVVRTTLEDMDVAGTTIPKGSNVIGMIISANRDERVFDEPDVLDIGRDPNRHIGFAFGTHYCLGNQLARLEARAAIGKLVERFEHIELAVPREELTWKPTQPLRGLRSLPLRLR